MAVAPERAGPRPTFFAHFVERVPLHRTSGLRSPVLDLRINEPVLKSTIEYCRGKGSTLPLLFGETQEHG